MKRIPFLFLFMPVMLGLPVACQRSAPSAAVAPAIVAAPTGKVTKPVVSASWPLPVSAAAQPDLIVAPDGALLLSWIETDGDAHALKFARYADDVWSAPREIARGDDWFVNWADTPHLAATADGALWAHWLRKSAKATYAYDVALVRSGDGGTTWSQPLLVNDDGTPTEHGFVSLWPAARDRVGIAWLDGRHSGGEGHGGQGDHASAGAGPMPAMTLRTATFDAALQRFDERELDTMTCDCCQTDAALTARGPLLVYRDRTPEEIRDIAVTRFDGAAWTSPHPLHADRWTMPACPVNGPAVAAAGERVVVAWYTAAGNEPTVKLARSDDAGDTFAAASTLEQGAAVQGRVDVAVDDNSAWVLWTREDGAGQSLQFARYTPDLSRELQRGEVARLRGRGRATGFAQLAVHDGAAYVVWTDVVDGRPQLRGARYGSAR